MRGNQSERKCNPALINPTVPEEISCRKKYYFYEMHGKCLRKSEQLHFLTGEFVWSVKDWKGFGDILRNMVKLILNYTFSKLVSLLFLVMIHIIKLFNINNQSIIHRLPIKMFHVFLHNKIAIFALKIKLIQSSGKNSTKTNLARAHTGTLSSVLYWIREMH